MARLGDKGILRMDNVKVAQELVKMAARLAPGRVSFGTLIELGKKELEEALASEDTIE